ncbi:MAG: hypothetical protein FJX52_16080 [Alphaproteobacteria bacterium]|nr:hypothetical protein [Alphaproteobacteria bacterium]
MIGPNDVITVGLVVFDRASGGYATSIEIVPAQTGSSQPFGTVTGTRAYIPTSYAAIEDTGHDIAVIRTSSNIGERTGWFGLRQVSGSELINRVIDNAGYPADLQGGRFMYGARDTSDFISGNNIYYDGALDTFGGQSGSGLWLAEGASHTIVGVHTTGSSSFNHGTALTPDLYREVIAWACDDGDGALIGTGRSRSGTTGTAPSGSTGTDGDDRMIGSSGADTMRLFAGNDSCHGGEGDETIYGNTGDDTLDGEGGNDRLYGGRDSDSLMGQSGDDLIYGNLGDDRLYGGAGGYTIYGGQGGDLMLGGDGGDVLFGNLGDDTLYGANAQSSSGAGGDTLYGGAGTDTAVFLNAQSSYRITRHGDGSLIVDDVERLYEIEFLRFNNATVSADFFL